ncbi:hypothetical protein EUTSA_v10027861mg [Eutrema salsugineum]|uniref:RRM domain-containing protein n=1 Tax=Eutrema salsugineum TaxID=72664 RepID=V4M4S7_EUTSA|nr:THO complex subunit 4D [Eutrema salsugineum]ESQ47293.1 hypothetical protein EUTSA_v10027861mg [Eutrema salsugineum]
MSGSLNMTLDDIVKSGKAARSRGRGGSRRGRGQGHGHGQGHGPNGFLGGGGRGTGPVRRGPLAVNARTSSFTINKPVRRIRSLPWQSNLFEDGLRAAGVSGLDVETRLHITNLDHGVTNEDIRELFSEIGELKRYAIHFDRNGRPSGTAEVVYPRRSDAFQALKKYNNVLLDGRPMRLEILGGNNNTESPLPARVNVNVTGLNGRLKRTVVIQQGGGRGRSIRGRGGRAPAPPVTRLPIQNWQGGTRGGRGGFRGRGRGGGGGGGRGRGGGGGRGSGKKQVEKSAAELDKDLESYHADAMNTS